MLITKGELRILLKLKLSNAPWSYSDEEEVVFLRFLNFAATVNGYRNWIDAMNDMQVKDDEL